MRGRENVWAIGDAAAVPDAAQKGQGPTPADRPARDAPGPHGGAQRRRGDGRGHRRRKFTYKTLGVFVDMGRNQAVAQTLGIRWRGPIAWFLARSYHLLLMPSMKRRARLVTDWSIGLFFGRDASELGMLGHPPPLQGQSSGGTGEEAAEDGPDGAAPLGAEAGTLAEETGGD